MRIATLSTISNSALKADELPSSLKVLDFGSTDSIKGPVVLNSTTVKVFQANQKKMGRDRVPIDFDHSTVEGTQAYEDAKGKPKPIAGYGSPTIKEDGLWLENITWTPLGLDAARNYEDLSPTPLLDENNVLIGLHSVALCPAGAIEGLHFYSADDLFINAKMKKNSAKKSAAMSMTDKEALAKTKELEKHEEAEIEAGHTEAYGSDDDMDGDTDEEDDSYDKDVHKKHMEEYDSEDHFSKYGDVEYADKENHKYPIDTPEHARAALSYINVKKNAAKYSGDKLSQIKSRIKSAAEKHGIEVSGDQGEKTKAMSVDDMPDAYRNVLPVEIENHNNFMEKLEAKTEKVDKTKIGAVDEATARQRLIEAFLAFFKGADGQEGPISNSENSKLHEFSAKLAQFEGKIVALEAKNAEDVARLEQSQKDEIISTASKEGKIVPLSADTVKKVNVDVLREIVSKLEKSKVPMKSTMKTMNTEGKVIKPTFADSVRSLNETVQDAINRVGPGAGKTN